MSDSTAQTYERILAIETATRTQAIALIEGEEVVEHRVRRVVFNHGSSLLEGIDELLDERTIDLGDIDLFCAGLGPGSFTGLRVGLATAKALARAVDAPICGISSLAALSYSPALINPEATVVASIDARRREVYAAAYRWSEGELITVVEERATAPSDWIDFVDAELQGPLIQVGDGQLRYPALAEWNNPQLRTLSTDVTPPSAVGVARLARHRATTDGPDDLISLEPNYIRPSDAVLPEQPPKPMPPDPDEPSPETTE